MTPHSSTGILDVVPAADDSAPTGTTAIRTVAAVTAVIGTVAPADRPAVVRPADLVSALTGVALCFFSLFVFGITQWQYIGPDVERASVLGWLAPLLAGAVCVLVSAVAVGVRLIARGRADRSAS